MCLCVWRTATVGGKTARMITPARLTGTWDGTGAQVSVKTHTHMLTQTSGYTQICSHFFFLCNHRKQIHTFAYTFTHYVHTVPCTHSLTNPGGTSITLFLQVAR